MKKSLYFHLKTSVQRFACQLWRDQKGAVAPLFLVSATVIFGASLGAIDLARYTAAASRLQTSLDSAALAAGRLATINPGAGLLTEAQAYFDANFPPGYMGSNLGSSLTLIESGGADGGTLTLTLNGTLPLISTGFLDVSSMDLKGTSVVRLPGVSGVEVVFALDKGAYDKNKGKGNKKGDGYDDDLNEAAQELASLLLVDGHVQVGLVPFADVVNVGDVGRPWVGRWLESWSPEDPQVEWTNKNYTEDVWRGCIAEPEPWKAPNVNAISALTPGARFQPVFVRVMTELGAKNSGNGKDGLPLPGISKHGDISNKYELRDLLRMDGIDNGDDPWEMEGGYDRRLKLEFGERSKNPGHPSKFHVYGAYEPELCQGKNEVRFLSPSNQTVLESLDRIGQEDVAGNTLIPAGLLWSWRMLHPNWRNDWVQGAEANSIETGEKRAIVLFAGSGGAEWSDINSRPSPPIHKSDALWDGENNKFAFEFDYLGCENERPCDGGDTITHKQEGFIPSRENGNIPKEEDFNWQYPSTSLLMANPYEPDIHPDTSSWPNMDDYIRNTCSAIKADGITIYVVDLNQSEDSVLKNCATDNHFYTANNLEALANTIKLDQSSSDKRLRLIR